MIGKCLSCAVCLGLLAAAGPFPRDEGKLVAEARAFISAMSAGDFELAARDFDRTMMKVSGPDKLKAFWTGLPAKLGDFKKQTAARGDKLGPYDIVLVTCEFVKETLDVRVVFDKDARIAGFQFVPSVPPAKYEPPAYADPARFTEREVTVGSGRWALPGTLTMPKGTGPFPALVLVHGSGPNDRDETLGPNKPFKDLAWGLGSRGIAVLRYDKRTKVYGTEMASDPELLASLTGYDETIDDVLSAVELLGAEAGIDQGRVFVLGHSLGGYLIPRIAKAAKELGVAGFIVMAGLTRPLEDTILRQMRYLYGLSGQPLSEDQKKELDRIAAEVKKIKALDDSDESSVLRLLNASPAYWLDLRGYQPAQAAKAVDRPMLILQGSRDYQVTTEDFENWKKAFESRKDVEFHLYPKLNHLFFEGQGLPSPDEYMQVHGSVALYVVEDIARWILGR